MAQLQKWVQVIGGTRPWPGDCLVRACTLGPLGGSRKAGGSDQVPPSQGASMRGATGS